MKLHTKTASFLALGALLVSTSIAFAEDKGYSGQQLERPRMASTTDRMSSSTDMKRSDADMKDARHRSIPGIVTGLTSNGFVMSARGQGNDHASTTLTVIISSMTVFKSGKIGDVRMASSTAGAQSSTTPATLRDVRVGSKVEVFGVLATSTKTMMAQRVHINRDGMNNGEEMKKVKKPSFSEKLKAMFGNKASTTHATGTAAVEESGFLTALMDLLFGWLR